FSAGDGDAGGGRRLPRADPGRRVRAAADAGVPAAGRVDFWTTRGSVWAPAHPDDRRHAVFGAGAGLRLRAVAARVAGVACAVRDRDGWRVGHWRIAGDGIDPRAFARHRVRHPAIGLPLRVPAVRDRLRVAVELDWLAR